MRKFKFLGFAFCALIATLAVMSIIPAQTDSAFSKTGYVSIIIDMPTVGSKPTYQNGDIKDGTGVNYNIGDVHNGICWYKEEKGSFSNTIGPDYVFKAGEKYKLMVYFNYDDGCENENVKINYEGAEVYKCDSDTQLASGADYYAEIIFEPKTMIEKCDVTFDIPVAGQMLDYVLDIPDSAPYYQKIADLNSPTDYNYIRWSLLDMYIWHDVNWKSEPAVENSIYHIRVWIYAKDGYLFSKDTVCTFNGETIGNNGDVSVMDGGKRISYVSNRINSIKPEDIATKIETVTANIKDPVAGKSPDYEPSFPKSAGYACDDFDLKWFDITSGSDKAMNPVSGKFEKDHKYRVDINLKAKEGYCFPETEIKATVNNKTAVLTRSAAYNAVLSQTFDLSVKPKTTPTATPTVTAKPTAKATATATPTPSVSLNLDKSSATVVCGKSLKLKATQDRTAVKVTWKSSDNKVATVDANGKVTAKMAGQATITATAAGKSATCTVTVLYKDVTNSKDFWYAPTNYLTAKGVVKGYANQTEFRPANNCTRAQMVTFIWRLQGEPKPKAATCKFSDVKKSDYFYKACIWGNENHIVEGYKDGTFGPQIVCARKHAVTFLWRLANKPSPKSKDNKFKDVKQSDYFYTATLWAAEKGILAGYSDKTFRPDGECLRRQMVTFLYKYDKFVNGKG